ncbi:MAG: cobalamin biosynthesis protein [Mycobacteriales bacterium]
MTARVPGPVPLGLGLGLLVDAAVGDPRRGHPVAAFGGVSAATERRLYRDARWAGTVFAAGLTAAAGLSGAGLSRLARTRSTRTAVVVAATWATVGGTTLRREARAMAELLRADDLPAARIRLAHLCGRDAATLTRAQLARGVVESVAENTSDAVVGPLLWGAAAGVPGLLGYRALNTLDAMVGHRSPRYAQFGWAAARGDDVVNLLPSRLSAALAVALAPVVGGRPRTALRVWRRDGRRHESPNAGQVEAAFAGALGRTFGGAVTYAGRVVDLPLLGNGPAPEVEDIARAARLSLAVSAAAGLLAVGVRVFAERR